MKTNYITQLFFILWLVPIVLSAQQTKIWKQSSNNQKLDSKWSGIKTYTSELNQTILTTFLEKAPQKTESQMSFLDPNGKEMIFTVKPSGIMSKGLQEKYPEIKTYKGFNAKGATVRFTITPSEMNAIIYSKDGTILIEPMTSKSTKYVSYYQRDYLKVNNSEAPSCTIDGAQSIKKTNIKASGSKSSNTVFTKRSLGDKMKKYRIAIAATGEFTALYGGKTKAMTSIITTLDAISAIFENDAAITFELVDNNDKLIYTKANDPYSAIPKTSSQLRTFNQEHIDDVIGFDNYDLGILFTFTGKKMGGISATGHVGRQLKAATMTDFNPSTKSLGLNYSVPYVAHEIAHLFEALHTFTGKCAGTILLQPTYSSFTIRDAYELGSGSTIMSYAGFCGYASVVSLEEAGHYFNAISIHAMLRYIDKNIPTTAVLINTENTAPTVEVKEGGFVIPINTPFALTANGADADNNTLITYCWEQFDQAKKQEHLKGFVIDETGWFTREDMEAAGPPFSDENYINTMLATQEAERELLFEGDGPLFRSFPPTNENTRYFPKMDDVLAGNLDSNLEVLPFKTRDLNFVVTVRDNVGGMTNGLVSFSSTETAGPFVVSTSFTESEYKGFSDISLEWDVANTNIPPVNCQNVTILYSINGGKTFDIILKESTPNDGSEVITLPNTATSMGRIMVKAADNIFFNVNSTNFNVSESDEDDISELAKAGLIYPNPTHEFLNLSSSLISQAKEIKVYDLNGKLLINSKINSSTEKLNIAHLEQGMYMISILTDDGKVVHKFQKQ
ncbi:zinc-dependent metalloprotease [Aquimarina sp. W85]|uniref:zinc-dependent metalloprotease n=1 Tax=Aquimarina rhodophyticola TaxID=3342246 RepID=UPI003670FD0A